MWFKTVVWNELINETDEKLCKTVLVLIVCKV